jgi:hypothetical protein
MKVLGGQALEFIRKVQGLLLDQATAIFQKKLILASSIAARKCGDSSVY